MTRNAPSGAAAWAGEGHQDDAPELADGFFDEAEVFHGDRFIRRGPGRPRSAARKELTSVRLDPDVLAKLREAGPGWQSQINTLLRQALGLRGRGKRPAA